MFTRITDVESDSRNKTLMKMFNLINIGECAGSGVPNIFNVWAEESWEDPVIEEKFVPGQSCWRLAGNRKINHKKGMFYAAA